MSLRRARINRQTTETQIALALNLNTAQIELMHQTLLVCGLEEARPEPGVHFNGTSNHDVAEGTGFEFHG